CQVLAQAMGARNEVGFAFPAAHDLAKLAFVRRQHACAAVLIVVVPLGVDQYEAAGRTRRSDHPIDVGQRALGVIGKDDDVGRIQAVAEVNELGLERSLARQLFEIDAQQLLLASDNAQFDRRLQGGVMGQLRIDLGFREQPGERLPRLVLTHHGEQTHRRTQRRSITRDISSPPGTLLHATNAHDGYRRFRRYATDLAEPIAIQHRIARNQNARVTQRLFADHDDLIPRPTPTYSRPKLRTVAGSYRLRPS